MEGRGGGRPVFWALHRWDWWAAVIAIMCSPYCLGVVYLGCQGIEACVVAAVPERHTADTAVSVPMKGRSGPFRT